MSDAIARLNAALEGRYAIERERRIPWLSLFCEAVLIIGLFVVAPPPPTHKKPARSSEPPASSTGAVECSKTATS